MNAHADQLKKPELIDPFARSIKYVRLSVTDRCDFRCVYCMSEDMQFLPRDRVLTLEELVRLGQIFASLGVETFRLTGGEPLIRRDLPWLVEQLAQSGEVVMTTNGSRLDKLAAPLKQAGLSRLNISLDTLNDHQFHELTRTGHLKDVLNGIDAAQSVGFSIKLNVVMMKGRNDDQILPLVEFATARGLDISFIEEMPLGVIDEHSRQLAFMSSLEVRQVIQTRFDLQSSTHHTSGPSRYWQIALPQNPHGTRIGFISPHSHNFCGDCNRVRVTSEGRLLLCLGNEEGTDLMPLLRAGDRDELIASRIKTALLMKPEKHHFDLNNEPQIVRFMNMTGG
ncbi:GTP 3',8-cyclase MoaA [Aquirhabdus sp.]|uniref:GTP 3',8-cyclase MoaA n=1 Tax=Aquirhabdus sp. TaxID=2824160 RepID=UPI00396CAA37